MKSTTKKLRAGIFALVCVLGLAAAATAQAGFSFGYYGGNDGRYSISLGYSDGGYYGGNDGRYAISLGYSDGGYYAPRYYAPRYYAPRYYAPRYAPRYYAPRYYAPRYYAPRYYAPRHYAPAQANYYYRGDAYSGPCRVDEITNYYPNGRVTCSPNPAYYGANDGYYDGGYYRGGRY